MCLLLTAVRKQYVPIREILAPPIVSMFKCSSTRLASLNSAIIEQPLMEADWKPLLVGKHGKIAILFESNPCLD